MYDPNPQRRRDNQRRFQPVPKPAVSQLVRRQQIVRLAGRFAGILSELCPESPELEKAIAAVDEAAVFAAAAIERNERWVEFTGMSFDDESGEVLAVVTGELLIETESTPERPAGQTIRASKAVVDEALGRA